MARNKQLVSETRNYLVTTVAQAKTITCDWLQEIQLANAIILGLPEIDDRYHIWRVPLCRENVRNKIGEVVIDAYTTEIIAEKTTRVEMLEARLLGKDETQYIARRKQQPAYSVSSVRNTIGLGDCVQLLDDMPSASVDLVFTSPPYFNARPEYSEYEEYEQYLFKIRQVIKRCHRVLNEGRFFVMNTAPVLLRRSSRNESSKRIAVPFDLHRMLSLIREPLVVERITRALQQPQKPLHPERFAFDCLNTIRIAKLDARIEALRLRMKSGERVEEPLLQEYREVVEERKRLEQIEFAFE